MKVTILGAGTMGRNIAKLFSYKGIETVLYDPYKDAIITADEYLGKQPTLLLTTNLAEAAINADLIIESAPEKLEIKQKLLKELVPLINEKAVVASNTSSYQLSVLSEGLPFAERMILLHFFNPADIVPLVEIVRPEDADPRIVEDLTELLKSLGKVPVLLKKDINGFIANRLQAAILREACYLLQSGVADAKDIDTVVKEGIGLRWAVSGPFEVADLGGLDIWHKVLSTLLHSLSDSSQVPPIISEHISKQELGLKSGKGFYEYEGIIGTELLQKKNELLSGILNQKVRDHKKQDDVKTND